MMKDQKKVTLWLAVLCVLLLTFAQISGVSVLIAAVLVGYLALLLVAKDAYVIPLFLFFLPWSAVLKLSPESFSFSSAAIVLVFAVNCITRYAQKFPAQLIVATIGIAAVTFLSTLLHDYSVAFSHLMFIGMLVAYPVLMNWQKGDVEFETCLLFFSVGIISATVCSAVFIKEPNLQAYINVVEYQNENITRYCGFYADPNFYSAQILPAIGGQLLVINRKKEKRFWNTVLALVLIACGVTSLSKSFMIGLAVVLLIWLFCQTKKSIGALLRVLLIVAVIVCIALASGLFTDVIDQYIIRFDEADSMSGLTTGRSKLWKMYFDFFWDRPGELFIGQGYTSVLNTVSKGSHNTLIQCIYQLGVIGVIFLAIWVTAWVKSMVQGKPGFLLSALLLMSCFFMWMGLNLLFFDDFFLIMAYFLLGINYVHVTEQEKKQSLLATNEKVTLLNTSKTVE